MSVGGSLVYPGSLLNDQFLTGLNNFIRGRIAENENLQFFIVVGGGAIARHYRDTAKSVVGQVTDNDQDWLGIHATRLNAHLLRTIFRDIAHPHILKHYEIIRKVTQKVVIGAGWKPGWSTDYCAVEVCEDYGAYVVLNLSNIDRCYDNDPNQNQNAQPIDNISWNNFRTKVLKSSEWIPGMNVPFDPIAAKKAEKLGLKTIILKGDDWANLEKCLKGESFTGTTIQ